jgi:hypothetical protein
VAKSLTAPKTMYVVDKFLLAECPKCRHKFGKIGDDWNIFLAYIVDGQKTTIESTGYTIIVCSHCQNFTGQIQLESWQLSDPRAARRLLKQGFVNLHEVQACGNMAKDRHVVYMRIPGVQIREM